MLYLVVGTWTWTCALSLSTWYKLLVTSVVTGNSSAEEIGERYRLNHAFVEANKLSDSESKLLVGVKYCQKVEVSE